MGMIGTAHQTFIHRSRLMNGVHGSSLSQHLQEFRLLVFQYTPYEQINKSRIQQRVRC